MNSATIEVAVCMNGSKSSGDLRDDDPHTARFEEGHWSTPASYVVIPQEDVVDAFVLC